jgi:hypothetical protein
MKLDKIIPSLLVGSFLFSGCSSLTKDEKPKEIAKTKEEVNLEEISYKSVSLLIEMWPENSKLAANNILSKYGLPSEATELHLIWFNEEPFKKIKVNRNEVPHNFPIPHSDVIEQMVNYKVPASKVDDIWRFNGSVLLDRTRGEMSARCEKEEMNILALNLADEIIMGKMSVPEARLEFARSAQAFVMGNTNQYTNKLNFDPVSESSDADEALDPWARPGLRGRYEKEAQEAQEVIEETKP